MRLTDNQLKILRVLGNKNQDGSDVDLDQLLDTLAVEYDWVTSKAALQWSLRQLIKLGLVERMGVDVRRKRARRILRLSEDGLRVMGPS
jgi:Fe2+ or Zn2+ uptake regulation protein